MESKSSLCQDREILRAYQKAREVQRPNITMVIEALRLCANFGDLKVGRMIHADAVECGLDGYVAVANLLLRMYSICDSMIRAREVFENMRNRPESSWRCIILGHAENGEYTQVLEFYDRMRRDKSCGRPRAQIFVVALKACGILASEQNASKKWFLDKGKSIHSNAVDCGLDKDMFVESTLVDMCAKCGSMQDALKAFQAATHRKNVVLWNCVILGYAENGEGHLALDLYSRMRDEGIQPSHVTILAALKACGCLAELEEAKLVDGKFTKLRSLENGMQVHAYALHSGDGIIKTISVENSLVDFYAKCGSMRDARLIFDKMRKRTVVSWTAMIWGYAENNEGQRALELYSRMKYQGLVPDAVTYVAALKAAASLVSLETGKQIHAEVRKSGLESVLSVANSLVDFYAKCGCMADAQEVFDSTSPKTLATWGALVAGYSRQGNVEQVLRVLDKMKKHKVQPDRIIFLSILTVCSHAGLVEAGKKVLEEMQSEHGLSPRVGHYNCMVDLLTRANRLEEAVQMVQSMPVEADEVTWTILLSGARKWKNVQAGKLAFQSLVARRGLSGDNDAAYVLMSGVFSSLGLKTEELDGDGRKPLCGDAWWCDKDGMVHSFP